MFHTYKVSIFDLLFLLLLRKTEDHESMAYKLYQFLFSKKGADMIDESGYIAIRK